MCQEDKLNLEFSLRCLIQSFVQIIYPISILERQKQKQNKKTIKNTCLISGYVEVKTVFYHFGSFTPVSLITIN